MEVMCPWERMIGRLLRDGRNNNKETRSAIMARDVKENWETLRRRIVRL